MICGGQRSIHAIGPVAGKASGIASIGWRLFRRADGIGRRFIFRCQYKSTDDQDHEYRQERKGLFVHLSTSRKVT